MIKLDDCKMDKWDYSIPVLLPDGRVVTILFPKEGTHGYPRKGETLEYGLNLVTQGHYT